MAKHSPHSRNSPSSIHFSHSSTPPDRNRANRLKQSLESGYEVTDANTLGILGVGLLSLTIGFGVFMGSWWLFDHFKTKVIQKHTLGSALPNPDQLPPPPRLQLNPQLDLAEMLRKEDQILTSFGRLKGENGNWVRIPIQDAMNLLLQESNRRGGQRK